MHIGNTLQTPYTWSQDTVAKLWNDCSVANRVAAVALAIILYPITYPFALLGALIDSTRCVENITNCFRNIGYENGQKLHARIEALRQAGNPSWREQAVSLIRKSRECSLDDEWQRLKGAGAVTSSEERMIDAAILNIANDSNVKRQQAKVLLGQVHELKKLYGDTHHVFTHAQSLTCSVIPLLVKELIRKYSPEKAANHFKFLRNEVTAVSDDKVGLIDRFKDLFGFSADTPPTVWEYINQFYWINDADHRMREMLLSADGYLYNHYRHESALFFLMNNSNILGSNYAGSLTSIIESIILHFKKDISQAKLKQASSDVMQSIHFTQTMITTGNLYAIIIPKEQSKKVQYRAHPFGTVCKCHTKGHANILEKLQKGILDKSTLCSALLTTPIPQFRLYTKALTPENGCKIFRMTPLSKQNWQHIKSTIKRTVNCL